MGPYGGLGSARVEGAALVVANGSPLPDACVKCASKQQLESRHQKFSYVPPWARLFGPLIQLMVMKKSVFVLPICAPCLGLWKKWNLRAFLSVLPGIALVVIGAAVGDDVGGILAIVGGLACLAGLFTALLLRVRHIVAATRVDKTHTWLTRLHPEVMRAATGR